jgi:peptidyl-prolyl cis-trans isomerase B (cyclophilin B)
VSTTHSSIACSILLAASRAGAQGPELRIDGLLHGANRPIEATLDGAAPDQMFEVILLDANAVERGRAAIAPGATFNLLEKLPALNEIPAAHWIQLAKGGEPVGSPWVAQPLLGRPPCRTAKALRPDGKTEYTRIIGWGDLLLEDTEAYRALRETWPKPDPVVRSGLRIYPDRDVVLHTMEGDIRVALAPNMAPNTAWNFRELAAQRFYDSTTFHRVVKYDREGRPFVIQGGDPTGTGDGSAGYDLPMEPSELNHDFGVISMARNDAPDTAGSQFFFCLSREGTARLDRQYCAFGWAVEGANAIAKIADAEIEDLTTGRPKSPPAITAAELVPAPARRVGVGRPDRRVSTPSIRQREAPTQPDR